MVVGFDKGQRERVCVKENDSKRKGNEGRKRERRKMFKPSIAKMILWGSAASDIGEGTVSRGKDKMGKFEYTYRSSGRRTQ